MNQTGSKNRGGIAVLAFLAIIGVTMAVSATLGKGQSPTAQSATQPTAQSVCSVLPPGWTCTTKPTTVFVYEDGQLKTFVVLPAGSPMRVVGQAGGLVVVGLDDGRKAVVAPVIDGKPTTELGDGWKNLPEVSFP